MSKKGLIGIGSIIMFWALMFYFADNMVEYIGNHRDNDYGYDTYDIEIGQVWFHSYHSEDPFDNYSSVSIDSVIELSSKYVQFIDTETKKTNSISKRGFLYSRQLMIHTGKKGDRYLINQANSVHNKGRLKIERKK